MKIEFTLTGYRPFVSSEVFEEKKNITTLLCLNYIMKPHILLKKVLNITKHHYTLHSKLCYKGTAVGLTRKEFVNAPEVGAYLIIKGTSRKNYRRMKRGEKKKG